MRNSGKQRRPRYDNVTAGAIGKSFPRRAKGQRIDSAIGVIGNFLCQFAGDNVPKADRQRGRVYRSPGREINIVRSPREVALTIAENLTSK